MWSNSTDPLAIYSLHYVHFIIGHFRKKSNYHVIRPDGTGDWLLILTFSGEGLITYRDKQRVLKKGDLILYKPGTPHDYATNPKTKRWDLVWIHFKPPAHWLPLLDWPADGALGLPLKQLPRQHKLTRTIFDLIHDIYKLSISGKPLRDWMAMNLLESALLQCHDLNVAANAPYDRLDKLREYIHRNIAADLSLHQLSKEGRLSVPHLCALFRQHLKTTPQKYIESYRMTSAKRLLMFPFKSIKEVAYDVGYKDPLYFSRRFRSATGLSPERYRETVAGRHT